MPRGRLPKPYLTREDLARGNAGHRPPRPALPPAPTPEAGRSSKAPKGLSPGARRAWKRYIAPAIAAGHVDPVLDRGACELYCGYRAEAEELDRVLAADPGALVSPQLARAMRSRDRAAGLMLRCADALGLTPVSRLRLRGRPEPPRSETAADVRARLRAQ